MSLIYIYVMLEMINSFMRKLLGRLMKAGVLSSDDLAVVNVDNPDHYLHHSQVMIGFLTQSTMTSQKKIAREKATCC